MVLYFAADLLWASKIKGVADGIGVPCRPVRNADMLAARLADSPVKALVVDLDSPEIAFALLAQIKEWQAADPTRKLRLLAWGPHVEKDLLQQARNAGATEVLTRGAFDHAMADTLLRLNA